MPGILHLYPAQCDFQTRRSIDSLKAILGGEIPMTEMAIGPGVRYSNIPRAVLALRSAKLSRTHVAHAWGPAELVVAAMAGFSSIIFSPQSPVAREWAKFVNPILRHRRIEIILPVSNARKILGDLAWSASSTRTISPGIELARLSTAKQSLRGELGLADSHLLLLAPGESVRAALHWRCIWSTAILNVVDERYRLITWGRGPLVDSLSRFVKAQQREDILIQAEKVLGRRIEFEDLAAIADVAILSARPSGSILAEQICIAAGLPIVAGAGAAGTEFLRHGVTAIIEPDPTPRRMAQCVLDLKNDAALRTAISIAAGNMARDQFSIERFLSEWRDVYCEFAGLNQFDPQQQSDCGAAPVAVTS
jgi:hypothetical protein